MSLINPTVKKVTTEAEMKSFLKLFDYWHKQGLVGFVPIFIMHRVKNNGELYVLKVGEEVIGIAWVIPRKRPYEFYQVKTLAIDKDYVSKGFGEYFLKSLITPLHKQGYDIITSVVSDNKNAIGLYEKVGFETYDTKTSNKGITTYEMVFPAA